jgi:phosphatidylinositol 4-kinase
MGYLLVYKGNNIFSDINKVLLHALCWTPVKHFTKMTMKAAVSCWEWILAAKPQWSIEVITEHIEK